MAIDRIHEVRTELAPRGCLDGFLKKIKAHARRAGMAYLVVLTAAIPIAILCFRDFLGLDTNLAGLATGGAIICGLLFAIAWTQVNARAAAERLAAQVKASEADLRRVNEELETRIQEQKSTEELLAHERELLRTLLDHSPDSIYFKDKESRFVRCGRAVAQRLGCADTAAVRGKTDFDYFTDEHALAAFDVEQEIIRTGKAVVDLVEKETWKDGKVNWVLTSKMPLFDKQGVVIGTFGMSKDITSLKNAQIALAREKELLAVTLRSIGDGVIATDTAGNVMLMNTVAEELTGFSQEAASGHPLRDIFRTVDTGEKRAEGTLLDRALTEDRVILRERGTILLRPDGLERQVAQSAAPIVGADGNTVGAVLVCRDITEKLNTEAELLRATKLESIGVLAGGIAHDFNNILTVVLGNISLSKMLAGTLPQPVSNVLNEAEKASLRARDLTQRLLTFAKGGAPIKRSVRAGTLLRDCVKAVLNGTDVHYECFIADDLWSVNADEGQLAQVFHNLIQHARNAATDSRGIDVYATNQDVARDPLLFLPPGRYVRISIRDHGAGLPPDQLNKIFDPYFSAKKQGHGLELATAYSIVRKHEGQIRVESISGEGTVFHVYLPAGAVTEAAPVMVTEPRFLNGGQGRVLVMDDEPGIRLLAMGLLKKIGYTPVVAADGAEAVEKYEAALKSEEPFAAVIMDLTVPNGMGGIEAIKRLRALDPNVKAIVSSGYSNDPVMAQHKDYGFAGVVPKPYSATDLGLALGDLLSEPAEAVAG